VILSYLGFAAAIGVFGWTFREPVLAYLYGAQRGGLEVLYLLGLLWIFSGIFGGVVTGYFAVSGEPGRAFRLNLLVMAVTLGTGVPAAWAFGAAGWVAAIVAGQGVVALAAIHHWKKERELLA
jgi:O-antigen/teichoic acid export membrane protein